MKIVQWTKFSVVGWCNISLELWIWLDLSSFYCFSNASLMFRRRLTRHKWRTFRQRPTINRQRRVERSPKSWTESRRTWSTSTARLRHSNENRLGVHSPFRTLHYDTMRGQFVNVLQANRWFSCIFFVIICSFRYNLLRFSANLRIAVNEKTKMKMQIK